MPEEVAHAAKELTDANFKEEVLDFNGIVLVDFWAGWCTPCKIMAPAVERLAQQHKENSQVKIVKLDVDANPETAQQQSVLSLPTFKLFFQGTELERPEIGADPSGRRLEAYLQKGLDKLAAQAPSLTQDF